MTDEVRNRPGQEPRVPPEPPEDVERLRAQNHEHAERRDREMAALHGRLDKWANAARQARELVRGSPVDWTDDPPSKEPDGWWRYTSQQNRDILITAVHEAGAQRDRLRAAPSWEEWVEAGFLDAYLNIAGVKDEARATELLREDIERLFGGAALSDPTPPRVHAGEFHEDGCKECQEAPDGN